MIVGISPTPSLSGRISLPASKSYSIRAFMIALCGGRSRIIQPSHCDDADVARRLAEQFGARIVNTGSDTFSVFAGEKTPELREIDVQESGTSLRFVLPLISLYGQKSRVIGRGTLRGRPNHLLTRALREHGVDIRGQGPAESIPIFLRKGKLSAGRIQIDGGLSSQFISALLIACPLLEEDTRLEIKGKQIVSADYITMTRQVLSKAGVKVEKVHPRLFKIKGNQKYKGLGEFIVPSDYGLAAFLLAAAALTHSDIELQGYFNDRLVQADRHILQFLKKMGVKFIKTSRAINIKGPFALKGGKFSLKDCPDLVPIMAVLALFAKGKTRLCHIRHAKVKESDRISDLRKELIKVGAKVTERMDSLTICPLKNYRGDVSLDPHHDHRLAMAFAVLGLKIGVHINDIECVSKSYPDFIKDLRHIGGKIY